jgi:hypothetical protein
MRTLAGVLLLGSIASSTLVSNASDPPPAPWLVDDPRIPGGDLATERTYVRPGPVLGVVPFNMDWIPIGPASIVNGLTENVVPENKVSGAIRAVAAHPSHSSVLYVGSVNGGIWRTMNADDRNPQWVPLTDDLESLSIGALQFDPTDPSNTTLLAGIGRYSSYGRRGGPLTGLLRTSDAGQTWVSLDGSGFLRGKNVSGVAPRGDTIVVSIDGAARESCGIGVFRSTDRAETFARPEGVAPGVASDLKADPRDPSVLYATILSVPSCGDGSISGVYKSVDAGTSWAKISDGELEALLHRDSTQSPFTVRAEIAVGWHDDIYVGIVNYHGGSGEDASRLEMVFRSEDAGTAWTRIDPPMTEDGFGLPAGSLHFSIAADPTSSAIFYVGGTTQVFRPGETQNVLGAMKPSGRLFRGDASKPPENRWMHLTHSAMIGPPGGGTAHASAPHADSRSIVFDASGDLIEVDDGGIYRRTMPRTVDGDWFSLNGNLQITEVHDIAYDSISHLVIAGTQDNGTVQQPARGDAVFRMIQGGDGGDVAVFQDQKTRTSVTYTSSQLLHGLSRRTYDAGNQSWMVVSVQPVVIGTAFTGQFVTPLAINAFDSNRLIVIGDGVNEADPSVIYESVDGGQMLLEIATAVGAHGVVAYGGRRNGRPNPDLLWIGLGKNVLVRTAADQRLTGTAYAGGDVRGLVVDPNDWNTVFVADGAGVFRTADAGATWQDVTGNLPATEPRTLAYSPSLLADLILVGTRSAVFVAFSNTAGRWWPLGSGFPNVSVEELATSTIDDVLLAGTLGRGAWMFPGRDHLRPPGCPEARLEVCRETNAGNANLRIDARRRRLAWRWSGQPGVTLEPSRSPLESAPDVRFCIYDQSPIAQPIFEAAVPSGHTRGFERRWRRTGTTGFLFRDRLAAPDGVSRIVLKTARGKQALTLKAGGSRVAALGRVATLPVVGQFLTGEADAWTCWQTTFTSARKNTAGRFWAKKR